MPALQDLRVLEDLMDSGEPQDLLDPPELRELQDRWEALVLLDLLDALDLLVLRGPREGRETMEMKALLDSQLVKIIATWGSC